jgi:hypothetical protein
LDGGQCLESVGLAMNKETAGNLNRNKKFNKKLVPTFLNKLLGLRLVEQKLLFDYFVEIFNATILLHQNRGEFAYVPSPPVPSEGGALICMRLAPSTPSARKRFPHRVEKAAPPSIHLAKRMVRRFEG